MSNDTSRQWHVVTPYASAAELPAANAYSLRMGWPRRDYVPLLVAACGPQRRAMSAWQEWQASSSGAAQSHIDLSAARLLAQVSVRLRAFGVRDPTLDRALSMYRHTWITNQLRVRSALSVMRALDDAGVRALALKGLALLAYVYHDWGLRPMFDVDLLVRPHDTELAVRTLTRVGWRSAEPLLAERRSADPMLWTNSVQLRREQMEIDLHWHALRQDASEAFDRELWKSSATRKFSDTAAACPHATELLLTVCLHGVVRTRISHTLWPADAHGLIATNEINWKRLLGTASARRLTLPLYDALLFLKEVLDTPVPATVLQELAATPISEVECMEHSAMTRDFGQADYAERSATRELMRLRGEDNLVRGGNRRTVEAHSAPSCGHPDSRAKLLDPLLESESE